MSNKQSYSSEHDQFDEKVFRESLGTFGTTTVPGGNQLQELQTKIRQGVKHVELHLNNGGYGRGKGEFNKFDTPDKYGFEQRRTIMQLAKLNEQTLSVHASLGVTSFSGLDQNGFNEVKRWEDLKEIDETIKFGAETAKGGAVVIHLQGDGFSTGRGELNLSSRYLEWLEKKAKNNDKYKAELKNLKDNYLCDDPLKRMFVDNPEKVFELKQDYERLEKKSKDRFEEKYKDRIASGEDPAKLYFLKNQEDRMKLQPDYNPYVVVGDQITKVDRGQDFVDVEKLSNRSEFTENQINYLKKLGIRVGDEFSIDDFQKAMATFTNGVPKNIEDESSFNVLKEKLLVTYENVLRSKKNLQGHADSEFFKKQATFNLKQLDLQKKNLEIKHEMYSDELNKIRELENESKDLLSRIDRLGNESEEDRALKDALKQEISTKNTEVNHLIQNAIGYSEYQELSRYDEAISQINKQKSELEDKSHNAKSLVDESFERNVSAIGHLGVKALKYQLDLIEKSKEAKTKLPELEKELNELEKSYSKEKDYTRQDAIASEISKKRTALNKMRGEVDYDDIDLDKNPLYASPENMLPGMGSLTTIEDFKAMIRMGQEDFAKKILDKDDTTYAQIRNQYEKVTGKKVDEKVAEQLAKNHLAGTFDTAHAGSWLKHFKRKEKDGKLESEEERLDRFNGWLNDELKVMVEDKLVKHVHFNDTVGKDDDHSMLGQGVLDMHELRKTLRKAGVKDALLVEYGGRPAFMQNAFDMFNPTLQKEGSSNIDSSVSSGVSDWVNVARDYNRRVEYSNYGMGYSTFRHTAPQQGKEKGDWSGTSFF